MPVSTVKNFERRNSGYQENPASNDTSTVRTEFQEDSMETNDATPSASGSASAPTSPSGSRRETRGPSPGHALSPSGEPGGATPPLLLCVGLDGGPLTESTGATASPRDSTDGAGIQSPASSTDATGASGAQLTGEISSPGSAVPPDAVHCPTTCLQRGIRKQKVYTDGTIRYGLLTSTGEPSGLDEALANKKWKEAMNSEYAALMRNQTWHLVPPQKGRNVIGCKWVYKIKRKADGTLDRYKARLVAKGFK